MDSIAFQLEGITSPMLPADWSNPHHMTLLPSSFYDERRYGIHLYHHNELDPLPSQ